MRAEERMEEGFQIKNSLPKSGCSEEEKDARIAV
jgi:hypothetical protein